MNKISKISVITFTAALVFLAGCKSNPVYNVDNTPIDVSAKHSSKQIKKAIISAGSSLGWKMKAKKKGHIVATLFQRRHVAIVDIHYNKKSYSITYKDSKNLQYDGKSIHKFYNKWIRNLDRRIQQHIDII